MKSTSIVNSWLEIKPRSESDAWPSPRSGHTCAVYKSNFLFVFGGMDNKDALNDIYQFNFYTNEWLHIKPESELNPSKRASHAMACSDEENKIFLFGGVNFEFQLCKNDLWEFDIITRKWTIIKPYDVSPSERYGHTLTLHNKQLYMFGGIKNGKSPNNPEFLNDLWLYSFSENRWRTISATGANPLPRYKHQTQIIGNDLLIIGGTTNQIRYGNISQLDLIRRVWNTISVQKAKGKNKQEDPILFKGRYGFGTFFDNKTLYIYGGFDEKACDDMLKLDLNKKEWVKHKPVGKNPSEREFFGFASSSTMLMIFGGRTDKERLNDFHVFKMKHDKFSYEYCSLRNDMRSLLLTDPQNSMADLEIVCNTDTENQTIWCHKMVLKQRWPALFREIQKKNSSAFETNLAPEIMQNVLIYVYTGTITLNQFKLSQLFDLLRFLTIFCIKSLPKKIILYLLITKRLDEIETLNEGFESVLKSIKIIDDVSQDYIDSLKSALKIIATSKKIKELKPGKTLQKDTNDNEKIINDLLAGIDITEDEMILQFYQDIEKISLDKDTSTFKIIIDAPDLQQTYYVHPPILIARSFYFEALFQAGMSDSKDKVITLKDLKHPELFTYFIDYIYTGFYKMKKMASIDPKKFLALLESSNYYGLRDSSLSRLIENYLAELIDLDNFLDILIMSDRMNFHGIRFKAIDFICKNYKEVFDSKSDEIQKLDKDLLFDIMKHASNYVK